MDASMMMKAAMLGQAQNALSGQYGKAASRFDTNYYDPYSAAGADALSMYKNALGLGGAEGNKAATGAFQANPGYQWQLDQGTQALDRSAAGRGMYGSGNNAIALTKYGQGLANQEYGNWLQNLANLTGTGMQAAGGQLQRQGMQANIDTGLGNQIANLTSNFMQGLQPQQSTSSQNLWSALLGGANLGVKALPSLLTLCDRRYKTDIEYLGENDDGMKLYSFRYKGDPKTYPKVVGPMAQDLLLTHPEMVTSVNGKLMIRTIA